MGMIDFNDGFLYSGHTATKSVGYPTRPVSRKRRLI